MEIREAKKEDIVSLWNFEKENKMKESYLYSYSLIQ